MTPFDPDAAAAPGSGLFGLDHGPEEARVHVLPVPFDATTSFRKGAAQGPRAILLASHQVELFDLCMEALGAPAPFEAGLWMAPLDERVVAWNAEAGAHADRILAAGGTTLDDPELGADLARVNAIGAQLNAFVLEKTRASLAAGKLPVVVGGDHATPFGAIQACAERHPGMGILHVDAHADLRVAFEGFTWSHASILHNVLAHVDDVGPLVQIGIRDLGRKEHDAIVTSKGRIHAVFGRTWAAARHAPGGLAALVQRALEPLPAEVYVTFDVDGLEPHLCPNTGTPVPGGLEWEEAMGLLEALVRTGRRIVGCDLNEVAPGRTRPAGEGLDEIVGARLLYRLIGFALASLR